MQPIKGHLKSLGIDFCNAREIQTKYMHSLKFYENQFISMKPLQYILSIIQLYEDIDIEINQRLIKGRVETRQPFVMHLL